MSNTKSSVTIENNSALLIDGRFVPPSRSEWIERFGDTLFRAAMSKVRNRAVAEDIVQDTFLSAIKSLASYKGEAPFEGWLRQILNNKVVDHFRGVAKERRLDPSPDAPAGPVPGMNFLGLWNTYVPNWGGDPEKALNDEQFLGVVRACIEKLPEAQRSVFLLKFLRDFTAEEICKVAGVSPSNSWVMVHRARLSLRQCIEKNWVKKQ